jgi:hypothetical protein
LAPEHEAASAVHPDKLIPGIRIRRLRRQRNVLRRPTEKLVPRNFRSGGALWGSKRRAIRKRLAGRLAPKTFSSGGALWSLQTDAGEEMGRPIIKTTVEEAYSKSSGHGIRGKRGGDDRKGVARAAIGARWELLHNERSGRILSWQWKKKETRMILRTQSNQF